MVHYALQLLGLYLVRRSPVGNEDVKGVSGGQKKRVSVAMEMMKEAPLFLLDEVLYSIYNVLWPFIFIIGYCPALAHQRT